MVEPSPYEFLDCSRVLMPLHRLRLLRGEATRMDQSGPDCTESCHVLPTRCIIVRVQSRFRWVDVFCMQYLSSMFLSVLLSRNRSITDRLSPRGHTSAICRVGGEAGHRIGHAPWRAGTARHAPITRLAARARHGTYYTIKVRLTGSNLCRHACSHHSSSQTGQSRKQRNDDSTHVATEGHLVTTRLVMTPWRQCGELSPLTEQPYADGSTHLWCSTMSAQEDVQQESIRTCS